MTHQDAVKDLAVEKYLLGELAGDTRERFEEHLFDCRECAADVKQGALFMDTARTELRYSAFDAMPAKPNVSSLAWLWKGWTLGPALAACLGVIVYQSAVVVPGLRTELAQVQTPSVLTPLVLANAGARGESMAEVVSPRHGFYLLFVDIPPVSAATGYRCSLYSPAGALVWHVDITPQQARDSVSIQVPASKAQEGQNELRVESILSAPGNDDKLEPLTKYPYKLRFAR